VISASGTGVAAAAPQQTTAPLQITTTTLPAATVGAVYATTIGVQGGTPPYSLKTASGQLPTGLALSVAGAIAGVATQSGTFSFTVQASDSSASTQTVSEALSVTVNASITPLSASAPSVGSGTVGQSYLGSFSASGGTPPYAWTLQSGSLPPGVAFSGAAGTLSGTPTTAGTYSLTVQAKDSSATPQTASTSASIAISAAAAPLQMTTTSLPAAQVGSAYSATLTATGGVPPYTWSLASGSLPAGLALSGSGTISGTPSATGTSSFEVTLTDSAGASVDPPLSITVNAVSPPSTPSPSTYASRTDTLPAPEVIPVLCSPAPCQMTSSDLNPGVIINRVTDPSMATSNAGLPQSTYGFAGQREWNSNTTLFAVPTNEGYVEFFAFNPTTQATARVTCTVTPPCLDGFLSTDGVSSTADDPLSTVSPYVVYGNTGDGNFHKMDFTATMSNPAIAPTVTAFGGTSSCSGVPTTSTSGFVMMSEGDGRFETPLGGGGQDHWTGVYIYDTTQGCRWLNTAAMTAGGAWGPSGNVSLIDETGVTLCSGSSCSSAPNAGEQGVVGNNYLCSAIHDARMSNDGNWVQIITHCDVPFVNGCAYSLGSGGSCSPYSATTDFFLFWNISTNNLYILVDWGGEVGPSLSSGHEVFGFGNLWVNSDNNGVGWGIQRTMPPSTPISLLSPSFVPGSVSVCGEGVADTHFSWNNQTSGNLQPVLSSFFLGNGDAPCLAWQDELVMVSMNGSGVNYRITHMFTRAHDFNSTGIANISRDGKWAVWCSDWGGTSTDNVFVVAIK
jgi:Putative Ig domain